MFLKVDGINEYKSGRFLGERATESNHLTNRARKLRDMIDKNRDPKGEALKAIIKMIKLEERELQD